MIEFKPLPKPEFPELISDIIEEYAHQIVIYGVEPDPAIAINISQTAVNSFLMNGFDTPGNYFILIYHNEKKIGYIWYIIKDLYTAVIGMIFINTPYRKNGFGHQVIEQLEEILKQQKISKIILGVFQENKIALSLYTKRGYLIESLVAIRPEYQPHKCMMYKNLN